MTNINETMWNKEKKRNKERGELGPILEAHLSALAAEKGFTLEFIDHEAPFDFLRMVQWTGDFGFMQGPYYVKVRMITGRMEGHWKSVTGGYLMEHYIRGIKGPQTVILGGTLDYDAMSKEGKERKHPLFISALDEHNFSVSKGRRPNLYGPSGSAEQMVRIHLVVENKMEEIIKIIEGGLTGAEPESFYRPKLHPAGPVPRMPRNIRIVGGQGTPEGVVRTPKANIMSITPRIEQVKNLSEELAAALRGTKVKIEGFSEGFPVNVRVLLEAGARELKEAGIFLEKMALGQTYEGKKERVFLASEGTREDGQFVVQVGEDLTTGELNLIIGIVYEKGEGRGRHTVSARLNFENHAPVVVDGSVVEVSVTCDGVTVRADFSAKKETLSGYAGGSRESKAGKLLRGYFPDRNYNFMKAFRQVLEMTRKTYGWLGRE